MMRSTAPLLIALFSAGSAMSAVPVDEYAWRFPVQLEAGADVHMLTLTSDIYRAASDAGLRDLRLVNAAGEELSFGPLRAPRLERWRDMPWVLQHGAGIYLPMPSLEQGQLNQDAPPPRDGDFGLRLAPGEYAARLSLRVKSSAMTHVPIVVLRIHWTARAALPEHTHWSLSDPDSGEMFFPDRSHQRYDPEQTRGETRLTFRGIDLAEFDLHAQAVPSSMRIDQVQAEYQPDPEQYRHSVDLLPQKFPDQASTDSGFVMDGRYPVHSAEIDLGNGGIASVRLLARDVDAPHWQELGAITTFDLKVDSTKLLQNRIRFEPTRARQWLLRSSTSLSGTPRLRLQYEPENFLIAHPGPTEVYLLAGHRSAVRAQYPVDTVMSELRERFGDRWQPQTATVGARVQILGRAALEPAPTPPPYRRWLLWALLIVAAAAIAMMALSLLKESRDDKS